MTQAKVQAVNEILLKGEPANISVDEHSGYTGYKPQAVVDAMNEVFWGEWGFEEVSSEITPGEKGLAIAQVRVWLKGVEFKPTSYGQNRVTRGDVGDARKGAQTDAIKKALSYFSIGNRAYHGLLPDKKEQARQSANNQRQQQSQPAKPEATIEKASDEQWKQICSLCETLEIDPPTTDYNTHQAANVIRTLQARVEKMQARKAETQAAQPAQSESLTYQAIYKVGKEKGLWNAANGFYAFASHVVGGNVNSATVKNLAAPNLDKLMKAVEAEKQPAA